MQPTTIIESGQDLFLRVEGGGTVRLSLPTWADLLEALRGSGEVAEVDTAPTDRVVGIYWFDRVFGEHVLIFYPEHAAPGGWLEAHLGTDYAHYVEVREDRAGNVFMVRDDLEQWTATDLPVPGAFFDELQALSGPEEPAVEWSEAGSAQGEIVAVVDVGMDGLEVYLYPDCWGKAMRRFVMG